MSPEQEPKYRISGGQLVNRATGDVIPDDEPVFIFRARDRHAVSALTHYMERCANPEHRHIVAKRIADFLAFAVAHPARMKEPDSPT